MKFCTDIHGPQGQNPSWLCHPLDFSSSFTSRLSFCLWGHFSTTIGWIALKFFTDIHGSLLMYRSEFDCTALVLMEGEVSCVPPVFSSALLIWAMPVTYLNGNISTAARCIAIKFCTDIHGFQRLNPPDFCDHLTFPLASPAGWHFCLIVKHLNRFWMYCNKILFIHGPQGLNPPDFGDPLSFPPVSPGGWFFSMKGNIPTVG